MKNCNSCGKCCIKYSNGGLDPSASDLTMWESERPDIFSYVRDGKIWIDPVTNQQIELCPWLRQESPRAAYTCAIYFDRPEDCRLYPATVNDMLKDECEMLEPKDRANLKLAQFTLEQKFSP